MAASMADMERLKNPVMGDTYERQRGSYTPVDGHPQASPRDGLITQFNSLDQHSSVFLPLIQEHEAPRSSCGAFSVAHAVLLSGWLAAGDDLATIRTRLMDQAIVEPEVRRAMAFIRDSRAAYVA